MYIGLHSLGCFIRHPPHVHRHCKALFFVSEVVVEQVDRAVILLPQSMTDHQRESLASHDSRLNNLKLCLNTLNKLNLDQLLMDLANDVMQLFKVRMY